MSRLRWGDLPPIYERGVDRGVLYLDDVTYPWNGLASVDEKATGSLTTEHYYDGRRLHISQDTGDYEAAITAYMYPEPFSEYNGYSPRQTYKRFGISYRTQLADVYKIHLVYNALVDDQSRAWSTVNELAHPSTFTWDIHASAVPVPGASPCAHLTLETHRDESVLAGLEDILYGTDISKPRLPSPEEIIQLYEDATTLKITYNDDGTYTASGPDDVVTLLPDGQFQINAPTVNLIDSGQFQVQSY